MKLKIRFPGTSSGKTSLLTHLTEEDIPAIKSKSAVLGNITLPIAERLTEIECLMLQIDSAKIFN